jgi:two-component system OmpR family response regulator
MTAIRVLHVDDEPDIREVVELSLRLDSVFATKSCGSGEDALAVAVEWRPDIILLDVMMPVMGGPATLIQLRESARTASIPVIFMTARARGPRGRSFSYAWRRRCDPEAIRLDDAGGFGAQLRTTGARSDGRFAGRVPAEG